MPHIKREVNRCGLLGKLLNYVDCSGKIKSLNKPKYIYDDETASIVLMKMLNMLMKLAADKSRSIAFNFVLRSLTFKFLEGVWVG